MKYNTEDLKRNIAEADKIVIGIGRELQNCQEEEALDAYRKLLEQVKEKDYFIISLNTDDLIYKCGFDDNRIVCPCGSDARLQCPDNCDGELYNASMLDSDAVCPKCGKKLVANTIDAPKYNENGYLEHWGVYTKWLQNTLNRKLVLMELGVGMDFPGVIHFPFEKVCLYNQKAILYRVHNTFSMIPEEIVEKACDISMNAVTFCRNEFVF